MSDVSSSSGERQESHAAKEHSRRARQVIMMGTVVACAAGAVTTSLSSFSPPKTSAAAYPPSVQTRQSLPAPAPSDTATNTPLPILKKHSHHKSEKHKTQEADVVSATYPMDADQEDIPALALMAYRRAAYEQSKRTPGCHLSWTLLAAIGKVESNHARGGSLTGDGFTASPIFGPVLDGAPFAALRDSDQGRVDGNTAWDRAVGPMQFVPPTWKRWGITTRPTVAADPSNIFDASTSAASYLCANSRDLNDPLQLNQAVLSYNHSEKYLRDVLAWNSAYGFGHPSMSAEARGGDTGLADLTGLQGVQSTRPASSAKAVVAALRKGVRQVGKKISSEAAGKLSTSHKTAQRPAPLPSQRATASPQPRQVITNTSVANMPPVRLPVISPEPWGPKQPLLKALLRTPKAPSRPRVSPSPSRARQDTTQLSGLVRSLGDALPTSPLSGTNPADVAGVSAITDTL
ncbi:hypothetical protein [Streptomyces sp. NPDC007205]|uniref:lytic transglycosylase domain-containing protein n=1 Tax=Streptomyces sp. NPDC007205 TaxID=3154316 RepID=UPI0033FA8E3D